MDNDYEEESEGMILSIGEDGKTELQSKAGYDKVIEKQERLTTEFIQENLDLFKQFLDKKGISEEEFNGTVKE